jgi:hypothetical protein
MTLDRLPRGEEDVGHVAERPPRAGTGVGADSGRDAKHLAAELEAHAVLGVAAVDLVADPDAGVDVAAAALEEEGDAAEVALEHLTGRAGEVGRGDCRAPADGDGVGRVAKGDGDGQAVEVVHPDHAHGRVDGVIGRLAEYPMAVPELTPVDADPALAPAAAQPGRPQRGIRLRDGVDDPRA